MSSTTAVVSIAAPLFGLTNHFWKYEDSNTDLGQVWRAVNYDDSGWKTGRGIFAWEDNPILTPLTNTVLTLKDSGGVNSIMTHYFRTSFVITNDPATVILVTSNYFDDGAVVYLNGAEAFRYNMPAGNVQFNTAAIGVNPVGEGAFVVSNILSDLLVQGTNIVAVEHHQLAPTSSDTAFGMALSVRDIPEGPLRIAAQPSSATVFVGDNATISIQLLDPSRPRYQWFHNDIALAGATNSTVALTNTSFGQSGTYLVVVSNSFGSVTSSVATLNVVGGELKLRLLEFTNTWRFEQSGADLGTAWRAPGYDDISWQSGPGVFWRLSSSGFPEPLNTPLSFGPITYYFRSHFFLPAGASNVVLLASNLLDDGAVFHVNGSEVGRIRLDGNVTSTTHASTASANGRVYEPVLFSLTNLFREGDNVLAVEVHQASAGVTDAVFGMNLSAYAAFHQSPLIISSPAPQSVQEGTPASFAADVFGGQPFFIQWFHNNAALPGETNLTLYIPAVHGATAGNYSFTISNSVNAVTSSVATLSIIPDVAQPVLTDAFATNNPEGIVVIFSESVTVQSATNIANYTLSPAANILGAQSIAPNRVLLMTSGLDVQFDYTLTISNVLDLADSPNVIAPGSSVRVRPNRLAVATGLLQVQTVFMIVMENQRWLQIKGSTNAPYINSLLAQASYCENYTAPGGLSPSQPNYIWLEAGDNFGYRGTVGPTVIRFASTNHLVTQLSAADIEWRGYMESMPYGSVGVADARPYCAGHNPFAFFDDVTMNYDYCTNHVRPYEEFAGDLTAGRIGRYNLIIPNDTNDMYRLAPDSASLVKQGDNWLSRELPRILNSTAFSNNGAVFITWGDFSLYYPIPMIVLSPLAKGGGYASYVPYDHSSTLRTMQEIFRVRPFLGGAANASPLNDLFKDLSLFVTQTNGAPVVRLENVLPGRTNYVQASSDLLNWTTISTNIATNAITIVDPGAAGAPQRFYRAIELP
jgi:hypothetical protein